MQKIGVVYIMTNINNNVLYTGVTSNIAMRVLQHRTHAISGSFTAKYNCTKLVWYKSFESIVEAIAEEKRIKGGSRKQKIDLINSFNPEWNDLWSEIKNS